MCVDRRGFLQTSAAAVAAAFMPVSGLAQQSNVPAAIRNLRPMTSGIQPISDTERESRIENARKLMIANRIDAVYLEPGSSMFYFTGVRWGLSERMFGLVIPARGEIGWVTPGFEEERARELIRFGKDIRTWEEDESPYKRVAQILQDRGIRTGRVGMEERVRFFLFDGIRKEASRLDYVSADPISAGSRVIKSSTEIALMQKANDITIEAYRAVLASLREGMTQAEFADNCTAAFSALGVVGGAGANFGNASAFPHGSIQPQRLKEGDIVLMDGGCSVDGYQSDISRTVVFGKPTAHQRDIWNLERKAQDAAFAAAKVSVPCEAVDAAARKVITDAGFGPDYKVPGLPHRTGHGIGLDGHEWTNLVRGNKTPLRPGMCFSDEPMITNYKEFGVRLEDCMYITESGAKFFTAQSRSIEEPFG